MHTISPTVWSVIAGHPVPSPSFPVISSQDGSFPHPLRQILLCVGVKTPHVVLTRAHTPGTWWQMETCTAGSGSLLLCRPQLWTPYCWQLHGKPWDTVMPGLLTQGSHKATDVQCVNHWAKGAVSSGTWYWQLTLYLERRGSPAVGCCTRQMWNSSYFVTLNKTLKGSVYVFGFKWCFLNFCFEFCIFNASESAVQLRCVKI